MLLCGFRHFRRSTPARESQKKEDQRAFQTTSFCMLAIEMPAGKCRLTMTQLQYKEVLGYNIEGFLHKHHSFMLFLCCESEKIVKLMINTGIY